MTNEYGEVLEDGTLRFSRTLPGPIERVWAWLIEPDKRALWLCGGETGAAPGEPIVLAFDNSTLTPHADDLPPEKYNDVGGAVSFEGEITAIEPPHLLAFTWPDRDGPPGVVTIRLEEAGDNVRLVLTHNGITRAEDIIGASGGWHVHLQIFADKLENKVPEPFWSSHTEAEAAYEKRFASELARLKSSC
jgi:uncharacterized protein YndB with AHSA1/START domain